MEQHIIHISIYLAYYVIGAYATTDIVRLLKGCSTPVNAPDCYCPICCQKIALKDQLPIISYLKNSGTCNSCGSTIPFSDIFLEIFLFISMSCITFILDFNWYAYVCSLLIYESTKLVFLLHYGHRENEFQKNLRCSLLNNLLLFLLIALLFLLANIS